MMLPNLRSWLRLVLGLLPFLLPPLALALAIWLQPEDHMGPFPDRAPRVGKLVYDDWDWSAVVLRGLNASRGRKAGLLEEPHPTDEEYCAGIDDPQYVLAERYYLEYPVVATWFFRVPYLYHRVEAPAAVCDGHYGNVIFHRPRNDAERALWRTFRRVWQEYAAFMVGCLLLMMALVRWGYEANGGLAGPAWLLVLPGALYFTLNRFDVLPAVLTALSLACLGRGRLSASALFLGVGTLVKVYPLLLAPLIFRYLCERPRAALLWAAVYGGTVAFLFAAPVLASDWQAVLGPYLYQLKRQPMGPTAYGFVVPESYAANDLTGRTFRIGTLAVTMLVLFVSRPPDLASVLRRGAVAVILFANLSVFYSPQWILWFSPLLVPLAGRNWGLGLLVAALDVVTYLTFPMLITAGYRGLPLLADHAAQLDEAWEGMCAGLVYARFVILGALLVTLVWGEVRAWRPQPTVQPA